MSKLLAEKIHIARYKPSQTINCSLRGFLFLLLDTRKIITFVPATKHHQLWTTKTTYNTLI